MANSTSTKQGLRSTRNVSSLNQPTPATYTFDELYKSYVGKVYQKCLSMTKDNETARDYTQDIFLRVIDRMDTFQNRSSFSTWLYAISHNYCLDQLRIGKRLTMESLSDDLSTVLADQEPIATQESRLQELEMLLNNLPSEEVVFIRLRYEQGLSIKEIAGQKMLTESAVKMKLKRTRDKLQKLFSEYD